MGKKIFIADDDTAVISQLSKKLTEAGHEVSSAENGKEALDHININNVPHLIICDTNMPELNGLEICKELRKDTRTKNVPVLVIYEKSLFDKPFRDILVDEFLPKPLDLEKVMDSVGILLAYGSRANIPKPESKINMGLILGIIVVLAILALTIMLIGIDNLPFVNK